MKIYYTDKFEGGRTESHRLLEEALSEYTGDSKRAGELMAGLKTGDKGKPFIEGFDHFSISHTGSFWAVLVAESECGLDIQLGRRCNAGSIAKRIFASEDYTEVVSDSEFFRLWCRREALVKAIGGSVYETDLPSVQPDRIIIDGKTYTLEDISIPGLPKLYAAICIVCTGYDYPHTDMFCYMRM